MPETTGALLAMTTPMATTTGITLALSTPIAFVSFEDVEERFERDWLALKDKK